jgi:hypothetical protein
MTFTTPRGCFMIPADAKIRAEDLERDRRLATSPTRQRELHRAMQLDLLDFDFSPVPATQPSPPEGCEDLWSSYRVAAIHDAKPPQLVAWRTAMSDKALVAGLSPDQTFVYRRQILVGIRDIALKQPDAAVVGYTWRWTAPDEMAHLGIAPSADKAGSALFRRTREGWSIAPQATMR